MEKAARRTRFELGEIAGAFGDLGTFVPFVLAYIAVARLDAAAVLLAFGVALIATGLVFRTPFAVQPMKAIGAAATAQSAQAISAAAIQAASLATGILWLVIALTGVAGRLARWIPKGVTLGIVLGLGIALMLEAIRMMSSQWLLALPLLAVALLLVATRGVAVMAILLGVGAAYGAWQRPELLAALQAAEPAFRLPALSWPTPGWSDLAVGVAVLAIPQLPLTAGNALVAAVEQNNRLFPDRPTTARTVAASTGLMNLWSAAAGGVPMCHGAGGMAGQVQFGARTGIAPAIFGAVLIVGALFFGTAVAPVLQLFPTPVLGTILFLAGLQLALGICELGPERQERLVAVTTAAVSVWNVGAGFLFGIVLHHALRRNLVKL